MENLHREQLNPLEEAAAYQQLLDDFSATHDELARKVGRSRPHISNTIRLLQLPPQVQRRVAAGVLSAGHARALLALANPEEQDRLAHRIVAEELSVRAVEEIVAFGQHQAKPRRAAANGSSSGSYSPLGMVQAPRSLFAQNGPPGWTRNTSTPSRPLRYISRPALRFAISHSYHVVGGGDVLDGNAKGPDESGPLRMRRVW